MKNKELFKPNSRKIIWRMLHLLRPWRRQIIWSNLFGILSSILALFSLMAIFPILQLIFSPNSGINLGVSEKPDEVIEQSTEETAGGENFVQEFISSIEQRKDIIIAEVSDWALNDPTQTIITIALLLGLFSLLRFIIEYIAKLFITKVETEFLHKLTKDLYDHIINHDYPFYRKFSPGKLITRLSLDIYRMQKFIELVYVSRIQHPFAFLSLLFMLFMINIELAGLTLLVFPVILIPVIYIAKRVRDLSQRELGLDTGYIELIQEQLNGFPLVKAFAAENKESERYHNQLNDVFSRRRSRQLISAINKPLQDLIITVVILLFVGLGYMLVFEYQFIEGNQFLFFLITTVALFRPVKKIFNLHIQLQRPLISAHAILKVLDTPRTEPDLVDGRTFPASWQHLRCQSIGFRYGNHEDFPWILKNFDLSLKRDEIISIQGPNGSGKSTLALILSGLHFPQQGTVTIDDIELEEIDRSEIRKNIVLIHQEAILFSLTVAENIAFGVDPEHIEYEKVDSIVDELGLREFIDELPEGIYTTLGVKGESLSGGQRQLIALSRAFYFDCPILILDEPTNNLDQEKVILLIEKLKKEEKNRLVMIITHNPAIVEISDRTLFLQNGEIVEDRPVMHY